MNGLIIKPYWLDKIFNEDKIWEIRGNNTKIRGTIYLIASGTKTIVGKCELIDSIYLDEKEYILNIDKHKINIEKIKYPYKKTYAWVLKNPVLFEKPIKYNHPQGAVIWIKNLK